MNPGNSQEPSDAWSAKWDRMERYVADQRAGIESNLDSTLPRDLPTRFSGLESVGRGGMGEVFKAEDRVLGRTVALKAVHSELRSSPELRSRLLREARSLSALDHPVVCRIHDYIEGRAQDFLVLEWVDGETLARRLQRDARPWSLGSRDRFALELCSGLVAAHGAGVVHRDIKPQNIMVTPAGAARLLDFGIARGEGPEGPRRAGERGKLKEANPRDTRPIQADGTDSIASSGEHTEPGTVLGTLGYMSPEQALGLEVDAAADVYSIGLVFQELWGAGAARPANATLEQIQTGLRSAPRGVSADRAALIESCCSPEPELRPTATELEQRLRRIYTAPARRRLRWMIAAGVLVGLLALAKYSVDVGRERDTAIAARTSADLRRDQAEDLILFMVEDLRSQLESADRLDLLVPAGDKAIEYFGRIPDDQLTRREGRLRCRAFYQLGQAHMGLGDLTKAHEFFLQSQRLGADLDAEISDSSDLLFDLAQVDFYLGYVHFEWGQLDASRPYFESYLARAERGLARYPAEARWRVEQRYALSNLATLLQAEGAPAQALTAFEALAASWEAEAARGIGDATVLREWADSVSLAGSAAQSLGDWSTARDFFLRELDVRGQFPEPGWNDLNAEAVARNDLAVVLTESADLEAARDHSVSAVHLARRLVGQDPGNVAWRRTLAAALSTRGSLESLAGNRADALGWLEEASLEFEALNRMDPTHSDWLRELRISYEILLGLAEGDLRAEVSAKLAALGPN